MSDPSPPPFARVQDLFARALEQPAGERLAWLDRSGPHDPAVRRRVEGLLRAHESLEAGDADATTGLLGGIDAGRAADLLGSSEGGVPRAPEIEPGDSLGRYRIEGVLGRGGMGVVYLGRDPRLDRPVALKLLPSRRAAGEDTAGRDPLLEEARAASALDHPHIGTVYEVGDAGERGRFIAMAWYGGGTLRDRLARGVLPGREALEIAAQVAEGLGAAHARGLIHRDVKPENVVFDERGTAKIVDFGLATRSGPSAHESPRIGGTAPYMSPEQRRGEPVDARTDVWATGVMLHEMLTGRRPGSGSPDLPRAVDAVVRRSLEPDPDARFPDGSALAAALRQAIQTGVRRRRTRTLTLTGGALLMAGVAAGVMGARGLPRVLEASGSASGTFPERGWVLVADFDVTEDVADIGLAAREALAVDLHQSSFVNVMSRAQIAEVMARMGLPAAADLDLPLAMEVAERFGAGAVVGTTVTRAGSRFVLSGRAYDPTTGEELLAVRTTADSSRVLGAVERLSREVRARLGEEPEALARSLPLPEVTTPSLEALRLYAEAERAFARSDPSARSLARAAVEVDSSFAMAHRLLAAEATGRLRFDEVMHHIGQAYEHRDRLPERERRHVEAMYRSNALFEPHAAAEAYELLVARYPDDARAWNNLGVILQSWLGEPRRAFEAYARAAALDTSMLTAFNNGTYAAYVVGAVDEAERLASGAEARGLTGFRLRWELGRAFAERDVSTVVEGCARILASPASVPTGADDTETCGSMDVAAGRIEPGVARLLRARDDAAAAGRYRNAVQVTQSLATAELLRGDSVAAATHLLWVPEHVAAQDFGDPDRFMARVELVVQARLHAFDEVAERILETWPSHPDPEHWFARGGEALIAAAGAVGAGDGAGAIALLDEGSTPGHEPIGWHAWTNLILGLARAQTGDLDRAADHLRAATDPGYLPSPFATNRRVVLPLTLLELARVEEARGDTARAAAVRARLATLGAWADAGLGWVVTVEDREGAS